jgi:hypothetical protein
MLSNMEMDSAEIVELVQQRCGCGLGDSSSGHVRPLGHKCVPGKSLGLRQLDDLCHVCPETVVNAELTEHNHIPNIPSNLTIHEDMTNLQIHKLAQPYGRCYQEISPEIGVGLEGELLEDYTGSWHSHFTSNTNNVNLTLGSGLPLDLFSRGLDMLKSLFKELCGAMLYHCH